MQDRISKSREDIIKHYVNVLERSRMENFDFSSQSPYLEVPFSIIQSGTLPEEMLRELQRINRSKKDQSIDIVISLRTVEQKRKKIGLLLLPATVLPTGNLSADLEDKEPWIPINRLRSQGQSEMQPMVGELRTFWKYRVGKGEEEKSNAESWADAISLAVNLFEHTASSELLDSSEVMAETCYIRPAKRIYAAGPIVELYRSILKTQDSSQPFREVLSIEHTPHSPAEGIGGNPELLRRLAIEAKGSMGGKFPLTPSQRRANQGFHYDLTNPDHAITAVSGPPGTGKTTMLQSVVASLLVRHALEDKPAPLIVGSSTNNQAVTNIIESFSSVASEDPGLLDFRWIPEYEENTPTKATSTPLKALAVYCPSQSNVKKAKNSGFLTESTSKNGIYTEYSDPDYVTTATQVFLKNFRSFFTTLGINNRSTTLDDVKNVLSTLLTLIEDSRQNLIKNFPVDRMTNPEKDIQALEKRFERSLRQRLETQDHLQRWEELEKTAPDDPIAVSLTHEAGEPCQEDFPTAHEYVEFYRALFSKAHKEHKDIEEQLEKLRAANEGTVVRASAETQKITGRLVRYGLLTAEQEEKIHNVRYFEELDNILDTTLRYNAFWLAVHLYELRWLKLCADEELIPPEQRWQNSAELQQKFWSQVTSLTPCFVMTEYQLPKYFKVWSKDQDHSPFDHGRIDLLIIDEAGQVDTSVGAAAFTLCAHALVVGDELQLAPVWNIDPDSEKELATIAGLDHCWETLREKGLTASNHSSVMRACSHASRWCYSTDRKPGLFLSEHFRCRSEIIDYCNELLYDGLLIPSRPESPHPLGAHISSPFLFHEVAASTDQKRSGSRINQDEAEAIAEWIHERQDFLRDGYPGKDLNQIVGVVTPFAAQAREIEKALKLRRLDSEKITVGTAHRLQGAERPVVLFSSVYGDNSAKASFIDGTLELMNVAVSRAKDLFVVFGGKTRRQDRGPVFRLVHSLSTEDASSWSTPAPEPEQVTEIPVLDRGTPGYKVAGQMISEWKNANALPAGVTLSARKLNDALEAAELITRAPGKTTPTLKGASLGLASYESERDGNTYTNVFYSPEAQDRLLAMICEGELGAF